MNWSPRTLAVILLSVVTFIAVSSICGRALDPASPELVGQLTKGLSITPAQATGGAGTLFQLGEEPPQPCRFQQNCGGCAWNG